MLLDHVFILTEKFAPEAELLTDLGFVEGTSNDHPGQGTANRRFFFTNAALELLYLRDAGECDDGPGQRLRLTARALNPDASPFGLVAKRDGNLDSPSFAGWRYQPEYFEPGVSFLVGENSEQLDEPLCVCMPDDLPSGSPQIQSKAPFEEITELRVHVPTVKPSPVLNTFARIEGVQIHTGISHLLELGFGDQAEGQRRDLRPNLPLIVRW